MQVYTGLADNDKGLWLKKQPKAYGYKQKSTSMRCLFVKKVNIKQKNFRRNRKSGLRSGY